MAIFYTSRVSLAQAASSAIEEALATEPPAIVDQKTAATTKGSEVARQSAGQLSWIRLGVAILILGAILIAAIYTAFYPQLEALYALMLHSFELILGAVIGLLTGEAISR